VVDECVRPSRPPNARRFSCKARVRYRCTYRLTHSNCRICGANLHYLAGVGMELRDIRIFIRVAEDGDFSAASRNLAITPSAVSKAITRLEGFLNVRLLSRTSRASKLTAEGEIFLGAARNIIDAARDAESIVSAEPTGTLRIRSIPTFAVCQLAPYIPDFQRRFPKLRLEFLLTNERIASLDDGADIAIAPGPLEPSALVARQMGSTRWIVCAAPAYLDAHGLPQTAGDLAGHQCLNLSGPAAWREWPVAKGIESTHGHASNQGEMLLALARAGAGIVRLAEFHISHDLESGRLVSLPEALQDPMETPVWAVYEKRTHLSPRVKAFLDYFESILRSSPWQQSPSK
jgi:DNA-binding transcriptional LysR family regulator